MPTKGRFTGGIARSVCACLALGVCPAVSLDAVKSGTSPQVGPKPAQGAVSEPSSRGRTSFALDTISDGVGPDGRAFSTYTFIASDGEKVYKTFITFDTPASAAKWVREEIKGAAKILERGPLRNKDGKTVGERTVLLWPENDPAKRGAGVIRTEGPHLLQISSRSLEDALALEALIKSD